MKKIMSILAVYAFTFSGTTSFAGETYESEEAKLKITFPGPFDVEKTVDDETGTITFSLSCYYSAMLLIGNVFIYKDSISSYDKLYRESSEINRICKAFGSKYRNGRIASWPVGNDSGLVSSLNCGHSKTSKKSKGYIGNFYVIFQQNYAWEFVVLGNKETFDTGLETRFISSFEILN